MSDIVSLHILIVLLEKIVKKIVNSKNLQYFQLQNQQNCRVIFSTFCFYLLNINFNFTRIFEPLWVRNKNLPFFFSTKNFFKEKTENINYKKTMSKIQKQYFDDFCFSWGLEANPFTSC